LAASSPRVIVLVFLVLVFLVSLLRLRSASYVQFFWEPSFSPYGIPVLSSQGEVILETALIAFVYLILGVAFVLHSKGEFRFWVCEFLGTGTRLTRILGVSFIVLSGLVAVMCILIRLYGLEQRFGLHG
jgi:hypothetical protein